MGQKFYASADSFTWPNGAVGYRPGGPFDCLGPFARVTNCPIDGTDLRLPRAGTKCRRMIAAHCLNN